MRKIKNSLLLGLILTIGLIIYGLNLNINEGHCDTIVDYATNNVTPGTAPSITCSLSNYTLTVTGVATSDETPEVPIFNIDKFKTDFLSTHNKGYEIKWVYFNGSIQFAAGASLSELFYGGSLMQSFTMSDEVDTKNVTSMYRMFGNCCNLTSLTFGDKFNTSNVTNMASMFVQCNKLASIDLSKFDTSKCTNMANMFQQCYKLSSLDLSKFDTSQVTSMYYMFNGCNALKSIDVSKFDTSKVTKMEHMFESCSSLENLDLSEFDTSKITDMSYMFKGCSKLTNLNIDGFDTSKVTTMCAMFENCSSLTNIDISGFDTSSLCTMMEMFKGCSNLISVDMSNFDTSKVHSISNTFTGCSNLTNLYLNNQVSSASSTTFASGCDNLTNIYIHKDMTGWLTGATSGLFKTTSEKEINIYYPDTLNENVVNNVIKGYNWTSDNRDPVNYIPYPASKIEVLLKNDNKELEIKGTGNVLGSPVLDETILLDIKDKINNNKDTLESISFTGDIKCDKNISLESLFEGLENVTSFTFESGFDTSNVINMSKMFASCSKIEELDLSNISFAGITSDSNVDDFIDDTVLLNKIYLSSNINSRNITLPASSDSKWFIEETNVAAGTYMPEKDTDKTYIKLLSFEVSDIEDQTVSGEQITPEVTITLNGIELTLNTDYEITYGENISAGTGTITVTGKAGTNYEGLTKTVDFNIIQKQSSKKRKKKEETTSEDTTSDDKKDDEENKDNEEKTEEQLTEEEKEEQEKKYDEERFEKVKTKSHVDKSYMTGYTDSTFKPNETIKRDEVATILARLSLGYDENANYDEYKNEFTDLDNETSWSDNYVGYCAKEGILIGYLDGTFRSDNNMTRAEFTVAVKRMYDVIANENNLDSVSFDDIDDMWFEEDVITMASNNYVGGTKNSFNGERAITRAEACTIINNVIKRLELLQDQTLTNKYKDVYVTDWYYKDVLGASVNIDNLIK